MGAYLKVVIGAVLFLFLLGCAQPVVEKGNATGLQGAVVASQGPRFSIVQEIHIRGKAGFSPVEIVVGRGEEVVWVNKDPKKEIATLAFQKDKSRKFVATGIINPDESLTLTFDEPGTYEYWSIEYGTKGKVIVR